MGGTKSADLPMYGNSYDSLYYQSEPKKFLDVFLLVIDTNLTPQYSTYVGAAYDDEPEDVVLWKDTATIIFNTSSDTLVTTPNTFYSSNVNGHDNGYAFSLILPQATAYGPLTSMVHQR